jgi:para-aminobenzoate synthetase component I
MNRAVLPPETLLTATPIVEEITPTIDPWAAFQRLSGLPRPVFLDSAMRHKVLGRYSYVSADPFDWLRAYRGCVWAGRRLPNTPRHADPLALLAQRLARWPMLTLPELPPFQGGAVGLFGYDLCHALERLPRPGCDDFEVPDLAVGFYDWVLAFDHVAERAWLISTGLQARSPNRRRHVAAQRLRQVRQLLQQRPPQPQPAPGARVHPGVRQWPVPGCSGVTSNFDRQGFLATVRRAIDYVHAGDCFQINLAQRLLHPATMAPLDLYGRLRQRNAAPFGGYFDLGDFVLASASPERFVRVEGGAVEARPIKGTRPRGSSLQQDEQQQRELLASAKDRAENVMIVDLLRNDLGRVCAYGSVQVTAVCQIETYQYVHHLVSQVLGRLRPELGAVDLLQAAFPGGSVTGAPKIRAMEIIAELEPTARGAYCGSLGYIGFNGDMDTNILIRTFTAGRGWIQFPVGGGIVADSHPEREYEETWHKAEGMLKALH